ncbi:MAG: DUF3482 domain-containing protein [Akkermansiaceae bacterium]|nr:DUF3482 domain-containing protein [Akkermansiaceae bacterium]
MPHDLPVFAVVGRINMGKSAVLATLLEVDDDKIIRVSATPGETTRCQVLPVAFHDKELLRFIDTPGFSRPLDAMRAIQDLHGEGTPGLPAVQQFVADHRQGGEFEDEARLLEPVIQGAGILYVIDPGKPLRDAFVAEMEILRWTGRPRMALLNEKEEAGEHLTEWKDRLGSYFNLVRTFNAHKARFEERKRLIRSLLEIDEGHRVLLERALRCIEEEWVQRRKESADVVLEMLRAALMVRAEGRLEEEDVHLEHRRERVAADLAGKYAAEVQRVERRGYEELLQIYRHHLVEIEDRAADTSGTELEEEERWKKWGLSRGQLTVAGAVAGAAGGAVVDVGTGGLTHGWGTLTGGVVGALATFWKGADLPEFGLAGGLKMSSGSGRTLVLGPPKNENFPWILLDSVLHRYAAILARAHGRRDEEVLAAGRGESLVRNLPRSRRNLLAKWFGSCARGAPNRGMEPEVFEALVETLQEVEGRQAA